MCFTCRTRGAHRPLACGAAERWEQLAAKHRRGEGGASNSNPESVDWIMGNTKPCPQCKAPIQKNGGCNHMHCTICGSHFDW